MSRCEEHCVQRCWHPPCFWEIVTECVTSQPKACYPWLQKLIDTGSWTELVHPVAGSLACISVHESSHTGVIRVSLLTLYRVRIQAACLIVHGRIRVCVLSPQKTGFLSLRTASCVQASPRTVETAFSTGPPL